MSATYRSPSEERARAYAGAEALGDDEDAWDDGALMDAYNEAVDRYKRAHNLASGSGPTSLSPSVGAGKQTPTGPRERVEEDIRGGRGLGSAPSSPPPPRRNGGATDRPSPERREWRNPDPTPSTPKRRGRIGTLITRTSATRDTLRGQDTTATTIITPGASAPARLVPASPPSSPSSRTSPSPRSPSPTPRSPSPSPRSPFPSPRSASSPPRSASSSPRSTSPSSWGSASPSPGPRAPSSPSPGAPGNPPPRRRLGRLRGRVRSVRLPLARARPHPPRIHPRVRLHRVLTWANPARDAAAAALSRGVVVPGGPGDETPGDGDVDELANLLMSWYYAGYYTGAYSKRE